jgi:16S rRNA (guanine1207-N2)-methyltransferase
MPLTDLFCGDESYRAVASAEATFRANVGPERKAHFVVGNGLFDAGNGTPARGASYG